MVLRWEPKEGAQLLAVGSVDAESIWNVYIGREGGREMEGEGAV